MTGFKHNITNIAMIIGAVAAIIFSGFSAFAEDCEHIPDEVLRLHILANSDSEEDQALKYRLRDYMLTEFGEVFGGCGNLDEAIEAAEEHKAEMQEKAQKFIISQGHDYTVECEIADTYFTTRRYENYTLPAGNYTAVRFLIGEAEGKNWWCVMFPPLCLPAAGEFFTEEQSKNIENSADIEVKFALFELLNSLFGGGDTNESKSSENAANNESNESTENPEQESTASAAEDSPAPAQISVYAGMSVIGAMI